MASSPVAAALTEHHRLAQLRVGALTAVQVHAIWPLLDLEHLDATFGRWMAGAQAIIGSQYRISAQLAAGYYSTFRRLELGAHAKPFVPVVVDPANADAVRISLLVTGPVSVKAAMTRGVALAAAGAVADGRAAGEAMRHALSGGRDTISQSAGADPRALGWARAASGRACAFCAMLASRGPVYSEGSVDFEAHSHCSCSSEPVYSTDAGWPAGSRQYADLWEEATSDVEPGGDLLNTFRRSYESAD